MFEAVVVVAEVFEGAFNAARRAFSTISACLLLSFAKIGIKSFGTGV